MAGEEALTRPEPMDPARFRAAQRCTWISVAVNSMLTVMQVVVGYVAHSQSLMADGLHSLSDLLADFMVLYANRKGSHPADSDHPYGHGRIETAASLVLGVGLAATGIGLLIVAGSRLQNIEDLPPVASLALWTALVSLAAKEGLFRYMLGVAERLRSPMLVANAWHARSDAASSLVVAVGIGGSLLGYRFFDPLAAALVGFMIVRMGLKFAWDALQELIDTSLDESEVAAIRATLLATQGVLGLHELRTRRMAHQALVDAHVLVDARISVSEGHRIGESARLRVLHTHPEVLDVLVHVDAEEDQTPAGEETVLPDRDVLMAHLRALIGETVPEFEKTLLHYLGNRVEAELFLPQAICFDADHVARLERRIADRLSGDPYFSAVSINCRIAPR